MKLTEGIECKTAAGLFTPWEFDPGKTEAANGQVIDKQKQASEVTPSLAKLARLVHEYRSLALVLIVIVESLVHYQ